MCQVFISPYVVVAAASSEIHAFTAVCIVLFVMGGIKKLAVTGVGGLYSVLKAVALRNILLISVTDETSQPRISWLKTKALLNIKPILVTEDTSQLPIF